MSFHVGQRVVCVDADFGGGPVAGPSERQVCVVKSVKEFAGGEVIETRNLGRISYDDGICFIEIEGFVGFWDCENFRPVRETSIECLRAHLAPIKQREEA